MVFPSGNCDVLSEGASIRNSKPSGKKSLGPRRPVSMPVLVTADVPDGSVKFTCSDASRSPGDDVLNAQATTISETATQTRIGKNMGVNPLESPVENPIRRPPCLACHAAGPNRRDPR